MPFRTPPRRQSQPRPPFGLVKVTLSTHSAGSTFYEHTRPQPQVYTRTSAPPGDDFRIQLRKEAPYKTCALVAEMLTSARSDYEVSPLSIKATTVGVHPWVAAFRYYLRPEHLNHDPNSGYVLCLPFSAPTLSQ